MTYIFLLLIVLAFYYLLKCYMHRFSWYYFASIVSLVFAMYATFCLISTSGNYTTLGYIFGDLDKTLFLRLISNKMNYFLLIRIFNLSTSAYLVFTTTFICSYFGQKIFLSGINIKMISFSAIAAATHIIFYDPLVLYTMYCYISEGHFSTFGIVKAVNTMCHIILYALLITHIAYIFGKRKQLISRLKHRQALGLIIFTLSSDILYILLLNLSNIRSFILSAPVDLISIKYSPTPLRREFLIYVIIMFISVLTMFFVTNICYLVRTNSFIHRMHIKKEYRQLNRNLISVFHSVKNHVLAFKLQLNRAQLSENGEKEELLNVLEKNISDYIEDLSKMLNADEISKNILQEEIPVTEVLDMAISSTVLPDNISIERQYKDNGDIIFADLYYMSDAFKNILKNAIDAINAAGRENGLITVTTQSEFELTLITISDNGTGMTKKEMKLIFNPFYTTKSRITNWGIGLSSVYNTINSHNGNIWVKSDKNSGTVFYVTIPHI